MDKGKHKLIRKPASSGRCRHHRPSTLKEERYSRGGWGWVVWRIECHTKAFAPLWGGGQAHSHLRGVGWWKGSNKKENVPFELQSDFAVEYNVPFTRIWSQDGWRCSSFPPSNRMMSAARRAANQRAEWIRACWDFAQRFPSKANSALKCRGYLHFLCTWSWGWMAP